MKIAVFTDIHGNLKALKTVLEQIKNKKADKLSFWETFFSAETKKLNVLNSLKTAVQFALREIAIFTMSMELTSTRTLNI